MVANSYVQSTILAGPTKILAREHFAIGVDLDARRSHDVLAVRFPPGRCMASDRWRAAVTWVPVRGEVPGGLGTS